MANKTKEQIAAEIEKLKALKPSGRFADKTRAGIKLQIEELEFGFDQTADDEWADLTDEEQSIVEDTRNWKEGWSDNAPSNEWGGLVE